METRKMSLNLEETIYGFVGSPSFTRNRSTKMSKRDCTTYYIGCETHQKLDARLQSFPIETPVTSLRPVSVRAGKYGRSSNYCQRCRNYSVMNGYPWSGLCFVFFLFPFVRWRKRVAKHQQKKGVMQMIMEICLHGFQPWVRFKST